MISFCEGQPTKDELTRFTELLNAEVEASKTIEKILYDSRRRDRDHYTLLHRQLKVENLSSSVNHGSAYLKLSQ